MLTPKQLEVAKHLQLSNKEIALKLGVSPNTVEKYIGTMCDSYLANTRNNRTALLVWCLRNKVIGLEDLID